MLMKAFLFAVALAAPVLAYEEVTCKKNATQNIVTSITPETGFCTMLTGYGVYPVAPNEGCASVYCYGPKSNLGPAMPAGYILSANYLVSTNFTQVTGCIDSSKWGQNPTDDGGQMDSHGWPYSCVGFKKFVSLIEPATNTYCLRCCNADNNIDCNTSISTKGCWNVIPGTYAMADGSVCKPPTGSVNSTTTNGVPVISGTPAAPAPTGSAPITNPPVAGSNGGTKSASSGSNTGSNTVKTSAAGRASSSFEFLGAAAAVAVAVAASF